MPNGTVVGTVHLGRTWQLLYDIDGKGLGIVDFDQGPFAAFYQMATGREFRADYTGRRDDHHISNCLKGVRVSVKGARPTLLVRAERD